MKVVVEKVGERDGKDRYALVDMNTGKVITKNDVSEDTMRKYLQGVGETEKLIDQCFKKSRKRYDKAQAAKDVDDEFEDILSSLDLEEGS